jgi:hypothetical protein
MGWFHDEHPGHEGYVVGLIEEKPDGRWREIRGGDQEQREFRVERMKVACDCGWRSRVFHAGLRAQWSPSHTDLRDEQLEDAARAIWLAHLQEEARRVTEQRSTRSAPAARLVPIETWT